MYAVIDLETTGLSPSCHHRVIEIAIIHADETGTVTDEWETLVDPQRDVGASGIHRLTGADLYGAPTFDRIAPEVVELLQGRVPVAHNLSFDALFLSAEFARLGATAPVGPTAGLCTMRLARRYLPAMPRDLSTCCRCIGLVVDGAHLHSALVDARATARLLAYYISADEDFAAAWQDPILAARRGVWPLLPSLPARRVRRRQASAFQRDHFLARLAVRTPRCELHPEANSYLALIDRALLDRRLSRHEQDELLGLAELLGLTREDAIALHARYLKALGRLALADGVVTADERADLERVAELLDLPGSAVDAALMPGETDPKETSCIGGFHLRTGDTVVLTGEAPGIERDDLMVQARTLGLRVSSAVSGGTRLVVAADPDSLSSKARKARELRVPIVDYPTYFRMLDALR